MKTLVIKVVKQAVVTFTDNVPEQLNEILAFMGRLRLQSSNYKSLHSYATGMRAVLLDLQNQGASDKELVDITFKFLSETQKLLPSLRKEKLATKRIMQGLSLQEDEQTTSV